MKARTSGAVGVEMQGREPWRALLDYWRSRHVNGRPPGRRDIDPVVDIPRLISHLMLIEREANGDYFYRLTGSAIENYARMGLTGRRIGSSSVISAALADYRKGLDAVSADLQPRLFVSRGSNPSRAISVGLILPLVGADGMLEMFLVGFFVAADIQPGTNLEGLIQVDFDVQPPAPATPRTAAQG